MYQKRTLRELVSGKKKVWVYLESKKLCECFFEKAREENFHFGDLLYGEWVTGTLIAVHSNGQMGHLPYFVYSLLTSEKSDIVDYRKYVQGEEDFYYSCSERNDKLD